MKAFYNSSLKENGIALFFGFCGFASLFISLGIIMVLFFETANFFKEVSFFDFILGTEWTPLFSLKHFGVLPLITGTLLVSAIALIIAMPLGILISILISEYSPQRVHQFIKPVLEILAGIPTIVYGYFALLSVTPLLQKIIPSLAGFNALSPGIVMGFMILPLIISLSDDAINAVPYDTRMAAYALGSSRLQVTFKVVIPSALSGIIAAVILAASRAIGETMLVTIAAGMRPNFTLNPLVPIQTITAYIVQVSLGDTPTGTLEYRSIFAVASVLFIITLSFNVIAQKLRYSFNKHSH